MNIHSTILTRFFHGVGSIPVEVDPDFQLDETSLQILLKRWVREHGQASVDEDKMSYVCTNVQVRKGTMDRTNCDLKDPISARKWFQNCDFKEEPTQKGGTRHVVHLVHDVDVTSPERDGSKTPSPNKSKRKQAPPPRNVREASTDVTEILNRNRLTAEEIGEKQKIYIKTEQEFEVL
jgi:hypothetical protein